jgi:hypothetical protein
VVISNTRDEELNIYPSIQEQAQNGPGDLGTRIETKCTLPMSEKSEQ